MPLASETILNSIAVCILAAMMLLPMVNLFVGAIVGAGMIGSIGLFAGALLALLIMAAELLWLRAGARQSLTDTQEPESGILLSRAIVNLSEWRHLSMGLGMRRTLDPAAHKPLDEDLQRAA